VRKGRNRQKKKMESNPALSVYSEAKSEYMMQLCSYLTPAYFKFFIELLEQAKEDMKNEPKRSLWQFQNLLAEIEDWNMERVTREVNEIILNVNHNGCDFLEDLLTAVFVAHTKVLTSIQLRKTSKNVQISLPKIERFLFKVFCESAKLLWQSAYLMRDNINSMEKQQNYRQIQVLIENGIKTSIRVLVPVKSLLKDCIHGDNDDAAVADSSSSEEEDAPLAEEKKVQRKRGPKKAPVEVNSQLEAETPEAVAEAVTEQAVSVPESEPVPEPEPVTEPVVPEEKPLEESKVEEEESTDKTIHNLPSTKGPINVIRDMIETVANTFSGGEESVTKQSQQNIIVVDDDDKRNRNVHFNEYETIFDMGDEDGHIMQPTTFPELENRPPEDDEEDDECIKILEETGVPLGDDDFDNPDSINEGLLGDEDFEAIM
jgi:hypothetical protein